ncbi:MAG: S24/S26 family peptidase [Coriobacteriaceae bacterium]|nr:S24/S26 family peptidase [Coriobacteriaceae bacterium]
MRIEQLLDQRVPYVGPVSGDSMKPLIRPGRDRVVIAPLAPDRVPVTGDVVLLCAGGVNVLHRVIRTDGRAFTLLGDASVVPEQGVLREQIRGELVELWRDGKRVDLRGGAYRAYARLMLVCPPARCAARRAVGRLAHVLSKCGRR